MGLDPAISGRTVRVRREITGSSPVMTVMAAGERFQEQP
jgi:hypothetical protein